MDRLATNNRIPREGRVRLVVPVILVALGLCGYFGYRYWKSRGKSKGPELITYVVKQGDFQHDVVERGEIESSSNLEVRCEVKARNGAGMIILEVVDEGTSVEKGDVLCKLDSSALEQELVQQQIVCNTAEAAVIQAKNIYEAAVIAMKEYVDGTFHQEQQQIQSEVFIAEENLRRAKEYVQHSERLAARGYATAQQLEADRFAVEKAATELDAAKTKLRVLEEFTKEKTIKQLDSDIKNAEAQWKSAQSSYDLELSKRKDIEDQISKCILRAPQAGQVVHANEQGFRSASEFIVEPGATVREGQAIIRLPDATQMQVKAKVNESQVTLLRAGMPAKIRLDAFGEKIFRGVVTRVNEYPEPTSWFGSQVKEYATYIKILDGTTGIKPGLTAEVAIQVDRMRDVPQIPVQAIHEHGRKTYCFVQDGAQWTAREIQIAGNNDKFVVPAHGGVKAEEVVAMNPKALLDRVDLPEIVEAAGEEAVASAERAEEGKLVSTTTEGKTTTAEQAPAETTARGGGRGQGSGAGPAGGASFDPKAVVDMIFSKMDKNSDGKLSSDEIPADRAERFKQSDTNGDGLIDKQELVTGMQRMSMAGGGGPGGAGPSR